MVSSSDSVERLAPTAEDPPHIVAGRKRLVRAALKLFRRQSYHATSVGDLAREAGISVGAVYLYIKTKSDLFILMFNDVVEEYRSQILDAEDAEDTAVARLHHAVRQYFLILNTHRATTEVMYHEFGSIEPQAKAYVRSVESRLESAFMDILVSGIADGEFAKVDAQLYARNVMWLGHLWALNRGSVRSSMSIDGFIEAQFDFILATLAPAKTPGF